MTPRELRLSRIATLAFVVALASGGCARTSPKDSVAKYSSSVCGNFCYDGSDCTGSSFGVCRNCIDGRCGGSVPAQELAVATAAAMYCGGECLSDRDCSLASPGCDMCLGQRCSGFDPRR